MPQVLPSKDRTLFQSVVKFYETKAYKKGLKAAEQILRRHPDHGDTQAMKALILNSQGDQDGAFALAKVALRNDMKSHVCWHVYGVLYRTAKNYEEAIKAYKFALKLEPESVQIQRDLAYLQMQMRDYAGYTQSRLAMVKARPALRSNWSSLAIAQHLGGDAAAAERTLTMYEESLKTPPPKTDLEHMEAMLYKNTIIAESGDTERALEHLDSMALGTYEKQNVMETRARYLVQLDRRNEAIPIYRALLERNPEHRQYFDGLITAMGIVETDTAALKALYAEYAAKTPRGDAAHRIPLDFLRGDEFREAADQYLRRMLKKGIPSLFANIKALYSDPKKKATIIGLVEGYADQPILTNGTHGDVEPANEEHNGLTSPPEKCQSIESTDIVESSPSSESRSKKFKESVHYFLAQHYNYPHSQDLIKAMDYVEKAIASSPKFVDYHRTKARIYKHRGDLEKAWQTMEAARLLDQSDRYINTKAAKYQLRADLNAAALINMGKFTRNEAVGGPLGDLHDMQCIWFLTEDGLSYARQDKLGLALKRFTGVFNIFELWAEDQFDFHRFSVQKGQLRAYVDMIRWEDGLRSHPFFARAATAAVCVYVRLADFPALAHGAMINGAGANGTAHAVEQKKAARKARRAAEAEAEKADAKKAAATTVGADGELKKIDRDPDGKALAEVAEPLKEVMRFLTPLLEASPKVLEVQMAAFEVFIRRGKILLALRALLALHALAPDHPATHFATVRLAHHLATLSTTPLSPIATVLATEFHPLLPAPPTDLDLAAFNAAFRARHPRSAPHAFAALQATRHLDPTRDVACREDMVEVLGWQETTCAEATAGLEVLRRTWGVDTMAYCERARQQWPDVTVFKAGVE